MAANFFWIQRCSMERRCCKVLSEASMGGLGQPVIARLATTLLDFPTEHPVSPGPFLSYITKPVSRISCLPLAKHSDMNAIGIAQNGKTGPISEVLRAMENIATSPAGATVRLESACLEYGRFSFPAPQTTGRKPKLLYEPPPSPSSVLCPVSTITACAMGISAMLNCYSGPLTSL